MLGGWLGLGPDHPLITLSQATPAPHIGGTKLVQPHQRIDAAFVQGNHGGVGAKGAVAEDDVALFELRPKLVKEPAVVGRLSTGDVR